MSPGTLVWIIVILWVALVVFGAIAIAIGAWLDKREEKRSWADVLRALEEIRKENNH